jgi:hypothetical protein
MHVESVQAESSSGSEVGVHRKQPPGIWQTSTASGPASGMLLSREGETLGVHTWCSVSQTAWPNRAQSSVLWHWAASALSNTVQAVQKIRHAIGVASARVRRVREVV